MEPKETVNVSFRISPEEAEVIDAKAEAAGQTRAEYVRNLVLTGDNSEQVAAIQQQFIETKREFAEIQKNYSAVVERLEAMVEADKDRKCTNKNHAATFGVGHCFLCDLPIASEH